MKTAAIFMVLVFAAGIFAQSKSKSVKLNTEFTIAANQKAVVTPNKLNIEFVKVLEDSRCPVGVDCVWAGNAKVQIKISKGRAAAQTFELNTELEPKIITFEGFKIELVNLNPVPKANTDQSKIKPTASFIVRK